MDYQITLSELEGAPVLDVPSVVSLEQAIAAEGTSLATLMERAGTSVTRFIMDRWKSHCAVVVLCGTGNNGGDGWVIGRQLAQAGYPVKLVTLAAAEDLKAHPAREAALQAMEETAGMANFQLHISPSAADVSKWTGEAEIVVDALLGTGFAYDSVREPAAGYIQELRTIMESRNCCAGSVPPAIIAVDVPSGLNAQTGTPAKQTVWADYTITMITAKPASAMESCKNLYGKTYVSNIAEIAHLL